MKPLVSILVPAYNAQEWIHETLRSACGQTWDRREIIVVDDGSRDGTLAMARRYESKTVRVVSQENQGASAARNRAFSLCQGDYIQWLDADDVLALDKVQKQMEALEQQGASRVLLSSAWGRFLYRRDRAKFTPTPLWADLAPAEWLLRKMENNAYMQTGTWLVSREISEAAGPWDTRLLGDDDGEYFCRVLLASSGVRFVPESKVYYRMAGSSSLSYIGRSERKREAQWLSMKLHIGYLRSLDDGPRSHGACVKFLQNWLVYFYPERPDLVQEIQALAKTLGGTVSAPALSWKYSWIDRAFGRRAARHCQRLLPHMRWSLERFRDKTMFQLQNSRRRGEVAF